MLVLPPCTVMTNSGRSKPHTLVNSSIMSSGLVSYARRTNCNTDRVPVQFLNSDPYPI
jgi:hypothetical protein